MAETTFTLKNLHTRYLDNKNR